MNCVAPRGGRVASQVRCAIGERLWVFALIREFGRSVGEEQREATSLPPFGQRKRLERGTTQSSTSSLPRLNDGQLVKQLR
jgi:hypothetical protein